MESAFETKEQYLEFIKQWKQVVNDVDQRKQLTLQHFLLYAMLRRRDVMKCLSPSSKDSTLADVEYWVKDADPKYLSLWPFGDSVTPEMIGKARAITESK